MAINNTHTKKAYANIKSMPLKKTEPAKDVNAGNAPGTYMGPLGHVDAKFSAPANNVTAAIQGLSGLYNDIGEMSGFITDGYMDKNETAFGENAKFNYLPPGMDISNQMHAEIHEMPLRLVTDISYPGDGWMPTPRDVEE